MFNRAFDMYARLLKQGYGAKEAAKITQDRTGLSAVTGQPIQRRLKENRKSYTFGQYRVAKT